MAKAKEVQEVKVQEVKVEEAQVQEQVQEVKVEVQEVKEEKSKWAAPDGRKWLYNVSLPEALMNKLKTISTLTGKKLEEVVEEILTPNVGKKLAEEVSKI